MGGKMGKSNLIPTFIENELKNFLIKCKSFGYKREYDFLMSYLKESPRFVEDFGKYNQRNEEILKRAEELENERQGD